MTLNDFEPLDFEKEGIELDYKLAGVDVDAGNDFVNLISQKVKSTHGPEVLGKFGGFNGMIEIPSGYDKPILVSGTDGVGTKCQLATLYGKDYEIGIDLVAMCVNDVITCGARPLYFLDYIATPELNQEKMKQIIFGVGDGCHISECALLGGETAEHPHPVGSVPDYDVAGFCTGIVEKSEIIDGSSIKPSDRVIGLASSGVHSNGFSLIRYLTRRLMIKVSDHMELFEPTVIYAPIVKDLLSEVDTVYGMAHITGGGIPENLPRCLPKGLDVRVDYNSWERPEIFNVIQNKGNVREEEMRKVFNLGIGYCVIVPANEGEHTMKIINQWVPCWEIGEVYERD